MNDELNLFLFEKYGIANVSTIRSQLFTDLKQACSELDSIARYDESMTFDQFAKSIYLESKKDKLFWLDIKQHFIGNDQIINFINTKSKVTNIFCLEFLRSKYWTYDSKLPAFEKSNPPSDMFSLHYGNVGEDLLLEHLNYSDSEYSFTNCGKMVLERVPCFGSTPDFLVFRKSSSYNPLANGTFEDIKNAYGIAELKTSLTPDEFLYQGYSCFKQEHLLVLLSKAIKSRHFVIEDHDKVPRVYSLMKTTKAPTVNWITVELLENLFQSYKDSCKIVVYDFDKEIYHSFQFQALEKKLYVNFLTSSRGKQLLGQCLTFLDNNGKPNTDIQLFYFYLFLNKVDHKTPEYYVQITCTVPYVLLNSINLLISKDFYGAYISECINA
jgi:hypothetical protein